MSLSKNWPRQGQLIEDGCNSAANIDQNRIDALREGIDTLDEQIIALLAKRFDLSLEIGRTKAAMGRQVHDGTREQIVLENVSRALSQRSSKEFVLRIFKSIMKESADFQQLANACEENKTRSERLFPSICVVGTGLIGGAFARQVKSILPGTSISAIDQKETLSRLIESKIFDECAAEITEHSIANSSLIVLACPPDVSISMLKQLAPHLSPGQLVIDLCSTKTEICNLAENLELNGAEFIGAHPFFGTEKRGFENSDEVTVAGKTICLVPTSKSSEISIARLKSWFGKLDLRVFITSAAAHDRTVALTSHSIQLFASALGELIEQEMIEQGDRDLLCLSGGALMGLSRLMKSQPEMWAQIAGQNQRNLREVFGKILERVDLMLDDSTSVSDVFSGAARVSEALSG